MLSYKWEERKKLIVFDFLLHLWKNAVGVGISHGQLFLLIAYWSKREPETVVKINYSLEINYFKIK